MKTNRKTKKAAAMVLAVAMMAGVIAGCGSTAKESTDKKETAQEKETTQEVVKSPADYKIGIIQPMDHPSLNQIRESIEEELKAKGYTNVLVKNANGDQTVIPTIISDMVSQGVDMMIPIATGTAQAVTSAKVEVPVVFSAVSTPVEAGIVPSLTDTTGGVTGISDLVPVDQIFEMAAKLTPNVKTFGFVYNSSEINSATCIEQAKAYCDTHKISYKEATIAGTADIQQAAASLVGEVDAFFTPNDNTVASAMPVYLQVANQNKLPIYVGADSMVKDGGLATVGIDYTILGKQTADMAIRIAGGEKVGDNPVEQIKTYANMVNQKTANHLNIQIPADLKEQVEILGE